MIDTNINSGGEIPLKFGIEHPAIPTWRLERDIAEESGSMLWSERLQARYVVMVSDGFAALVNFDTGATLTGIHPMGAGRVNPPATTLGSLLGHSIHSDRIRLYKVPKRHVALSVDDLKVRHWIVAVCPAPERISYIKLSGRDMDLVGEAGEATLFSSQDMAEIAMDRFKIGRAAMFLVPSAAPGSRPARSAPPEDAEPHEAGPEVEVTL